MGQFRTNIDGGGGGGRMVEWEAGLPSGADLPPLYQLLIPEGLASAFQISPQQSSSAADVDRASATTFSLVQDGGGAHAPSLEAKEEDIAGPELKKPTTVDDGAVEAEAEAEAEEEEDGESATVARKRQRLVWTPELQRRFLDVVGRLGVQNAVPKTIMQMMNVEGLTRENVASHLQKYRIYRKQRQGFSGDATATLASSGLGINGGGGDRFPQPGPPVPDNGQMTEVPGLGHNAMQGYHHHHHHHHHYHHNYNNHNGS